jgi:hypothetical protein
MAAADCIFGEVSFTALTGYDSSGVPLLQAAIQLAVPSAGIEPSPGRSAVGGMPSIVFVLPGGEARAYRGTTFNSSMPGTGDGRRLLREF